MRKNIKPGYGEDGQVDQMVAGIHNIINDSYRSGRPVQIGNRFVALLNRDAAESKLHITKIKIRDEKDSCFDDGSVRRHLYDGLACPGN